MVNRTFFIGLLAATSLGLMGCTSNEHRAAVVPTGKIIACQKCYDAAARVRGADWVGSEMTITRHQCSDCGTSVILYMEDGTPMIKCARCAPEGEACDLCLPPSNDS